MEQQPRRALAAPPLFARQHRPDRLTRRQLLQAAAATAALTVGASCVRAEPHQADAPLAPLPIPGGTPSLAGHFHVFGPQQADPADAEPATITDFKGVIGLAFLKGTVTRTNTQTGAVRTLPFLNTDMRFMKGVFRGTDGRQHQGAFAFV